MTVEIRERTEDDIDDLVAIAERVRKVDSYPVFLPGGDYSRFLMEPRPSVAWVAVRRRGLIGHVALNDSTSQPVMDFVERQAPPLPPVYVARLLVDPGSRRAGVGRLLLEHAQRAAVNADRVPFLDVVDVPTSPPAIALYNDAGWQEIGRVGLDLDDGRVEEIVFRGPHTGRHRS